MSKLYQKAMVQLTKLTGGRGVRHRHVTKSGKVVEHVHGLSCKCDDEEELEVHHKHDDNTLLLTQMRRRRMNSEEHGIRHRHITAGGKIVEHVHELDCNCDDQERVELHHVHDEQTLMLAEEVKPNASIRRRIIQRVGIRILAVTCFILAFKFIPLPFSEWFEDFVDYTEELRDDNLFACIAAFTVFSVRFFFFLLHVNSSTQHTHTHIKIK